MRLHITDAGAITLLEPANFRGLDVLIDPVPAPRLEALIARIGRREGEGHIRLAPAVLRFLSPLAGDPDWESGFAAMLAYAAKHGWVDEEGLVRAHISQAEAPAIALEAFKASMRRLAAGVSAITTGTLEAPQGMVASSVVSISAEPPMLGVFLHETSSSLPALLENRLFAVNVLVDGDEPLVQDLVRQPQGPARFASPRWQAGSRGLPLLDGALAALECRLVTVVSLGTHRLLVGRIEASQTSGEVPISAPMVHFNGGALRIAGETA